MKISKPGSNFLENGEQKFRKKRQEFLYKERWDHQKNLIDADFVWGIKHAKVTSNGILTNDDLIFNKFRSNKPKEKIKVN